MILIASGQQHTRFISRRATSDDRGKNNMENIWLFVTLGLAIFSFLCSIYVTLRTLLPLLPPHPLSSRIRPLYRAGPSPPSPPQAQQHRRKRLKSAQRFQIWLAATDILSCILLIWEVAFSSSLSSHLPSSLSSIFSSSTPLPNDSHDFSTTGSGIIQINSPPRLYLSTTLRPTLLLAVSLLSYFNVCRGRTVALGKFDLVFWGPSIALLIIGTLTTFLLTNHNTDDESGLDGGSIVGGVWKGILIWISILVGIGSLAFGRLLLAIVRVRWENVKLVSDWQMRNNHHQQDHLRQEQEEEEKGRIREIESRGCSPLPEGEEYDDGRTTAVGSYSTGGPKKLTLHDEKQQLALPRHATERERTESGGGNSSASKLGRKIKSSLPKFSLPPLNFFPLSFSPSNFHLPNSNSTVHLGSKNQTPNATPGRGSGHGVRRTKSSKGAPQSSLSIDRHPGVAYAPQYLPGDDQQQDQGDSRHPPPVPPLPSSVGGMMMKFVEGRNSDDPLPPGRNSTSTNSHHHHQRNQSRTRTQYQHKPNIKVEIPQSPAGAFIFPMNGGGDGDDAEGEIYYQEDHDGDDGGVGRIRRINGYDVVETNLNRSGSLTAVGTSSRNNPTPTTPHSLAFFQPPNSPVGLPISASQMSVPITGVERLSEEATNNSSSRRVSADGRVSPNGGGGLSHPREGDLGMDSIHFSSLDENERERERRRLSRERNGSGNGDSMDGYPRPSISSYLSSNESGGNYIVGTVAVRAAQAHISSQHQQHQNQQNQQQQQRSRRIVRPGIFRSGGYEVDINVNNGDVDGNGDRSESRQAMMTPRPSTPWSGRRIELTARETRVAMVRIGGFLMGGAIGYGLILPFLISKAIHPAAQPSVIFSIFLSIGVCISSPLLALQVGLAEGFWYHSPYLPPLTSTSAAQLEDGRQPSPSSTYHDEKRSRSVSPFSSSTPNPTTPITPAGLIESPLSPSADDLTKLTAAAAAQGIRSSTPIDYYNNNNQHKRTTTTLSISSSRRHRKGTGSNDTYQTAAGIQTIHSSDSDYQVSVGASRKASRSTLNSSHLMGSAHNGNASRMSLDDPVGIGSRANAADCEDGRSKSRIGRAVSMTLTHPKLLVLPSMVGGQVEGSAYDPNNRPHSSASQHQRTRSKSRDKEPSSSSPPADDTTGLGTGKRSGSPAEGSTTGVSYMATTVGTSGTAMTGNHRDRTYSAANAAVNNNNTVKTNASHHHHQRTESELKNRRSRDLHRAVEASLGYGVAPIDAMRRGQSVEMARIPHHHQSDDGSESGSTKEKKRSRKYSKAAATAGGKRLSMGSKTLAKYGGLWSATELQQEFPHKKHTPSPSPQESQMVAFHSRMADSGLGSKSQPQPGAELSAPISARTNEIDFLSSKLLPGLRPDIVIGKDVPIGKEADRIPDPRKTSISSLALPNETRRTTKNFRNLSLPGLASSTLSGWKVSKTDTNWVEISLGEEEDINDAKTDDELMRNRKESHNSSKKSSRSPLFGRPSFDSQKSPLFARPSFDAPPTQDMSYLFEQPPHPPPTVPLPPPPVQEVQPDALAQSLSKSTRSRKSNKSRISRKSRKSAKSYRSDAELEVLDYSTDSEEDEDLSADQAEIVQASRASSIHSLSASSPEGSGGDRKFEQASIILRTSGNSTDPSAYASADEGERSNTEETHYHHARSQTLDSLRSRTNELKRLSRESGNGSISAFGQLHRRASYIHSLSSQGGRTSNGSKDSITSVGFRNQMHSGSWHVPAADEGPAYTDDSSGGEESTRNTPIRRLRPLRLLGERDANVNANRESAQARLEGADGQKDKKGGKKGSKDSLPPLPGDENATPEQQRERRDRRRSRPLSSMTLPALQEDEMLQSSENRQSTPSPTPSPVRKVSHTRSLLDEDASSPVPPTITTRNRTPSARTKRASRGSISYIVYRDENDGSPLTIKKPSNAGNASNESATRGQDQKLRNASSGPQAQGVSETTYPLGRDWREEDHGSPSLFRFGTDLSDRETLRSTPKKPTTPKKRAGLGLGGGVGGRNSPLMRLR